jgi:predicted transcriptional regulator
MLKHTLKALIVTELRRHLALYITDLAKHIGAAAESDQFDVELERLCIGKFIYKVGGVTGKAYAIGDKGRIAHNNYSDRVKLNKNLIKGRSMANTLQHSTAALVLHQLEDNSELTIEQLCNYIEVDDNLIVLAIDRLLDAKFIIKIRKQGSFVYAITDKGDSAFDDYVGRIS